MYPSTSLSNLTNLRHILYQSFIFSSNLSIAVIVNKLTVENPFGDYLVVSSFFKVDLLLINIALIMIMWHLKMVIFNIVVNLLVN
jgi:hypothetical protein